MTLSCIYFLQAAGDGPVKIGFTARDPMRRVAQIQTGNPWPVILLGAIEGTRAQEKKIHSALTKWKTMGEWFQPHPAVLDIIRDRLLNGRQVCIERKKRARPVQPIERIRRSVFAISQKEMAAIAQVSQATISKWENGEFSPSLSEMSLIRARAVEQGIEWNDSWFFETPEGVQ